MKLSEVKKALATLNEVRFVLPNGQLVPIHFHVTEVGNVNKHYIDCGGTIRNETVVSFQLWKADDIDHRLAPSKLLHIIELSEKAIGIKDNEVEVEYQSDTIGKYNLSFNGFDFQLENKFTDCLAKDNCGIPPEKIRVKLKDLKNTSCCDPSTGCC